jgi:hypothetical protein
MPPSDLKFDTVPYQPDGGFSQAGFGMLLALSMVAGVGLGWLASFIGQWFYLILVFPIAIGLVLGFVGVLGIKLGKVRKPLLGGVAGFFGGCVAMVGMQYFDYLRFEREELPRIRDELIREMRVHRPARGQPVPEPTLDEVRQAIGVENFFDYVDSVAEQGVKLTRAGRGGGINLGYVGTYIYWAVELLIVAGLAFLIGASAASEPFCQECNLWKESKKLGTFQAPPGQPPTAVAEVLTSGAVGRLAEFQPAPEGGNLLLTAAVCPHCRSAGYVDVKLEHITVNSKNETQTNQLAHVTYPGAVLAVFEMLFTARLHAPDEPKTQDQPEQA